MSDLVYDLNKACSELPDGGILTLENKTYHLYPENAFRKFYYISNNDSGDKPIVFPLINKKNITIDGNGAKLLLHGGMIPFAVDNCENITIRNFSIDFEDVFFSQAEIIDADTERVVLKFDGSNFSCKIKDNKMQFYGKSGKLLKSAEQVLCMEFDKLKKSPSAYINNYFIYTGEETDHGFLGYMFKDAVARETENNVIEFKGKFGFSHTIGNMWVCTFGERDFPGVFVNCSKNIILENINMHYASAMGVICQLSENIRLENVIMEPEKGSQRILSVKADATHFVNCRGKIDINNCKFVNMMDDTCNIHGIYLPSLVKTGENSFLGIFGHYQQYGINIFRKGDRVDIIDSETQNVVQSITVEKSELLSESVLQVTAVEKITHIPKGCVAENISTAPEIHISNTESGNNRPRGFLLSSRGRTIVEGCKFYNMFSGICVGGEMLDWYESGRTTDVTIRNNHFCNSAFAGGCAILIVPKIKNKEKVGAYHDNIRIYGNTFSMHEKRFLNASNVKNISFKNNTFIYSPDFPSHPVLSEDGISIELSENTEIICEDE